ncbi:D-alanyl-D-alanine carboxypeptidase [Kitasatospora sp. NA04385]|uniref:serine hydrolase n=1 Tax=Kitasatospora sp. NA04385 TaxID=2742135 RepID=UPI001591A9CB|nr:serine hydrolase [Kitasatospora sp. NA04385]QKW21196.1 D-alanyl-D-alanine carboxypeptidase [Kitasatospora sp. NA04385]
MGESPKSEPRDGETRSAETEETPREPGADTEGNGTVHLRVRDADTRTTDLRLPADLPESSAALTAPRSTPQDEDTPESETPSAEEQAEPEEPDAPAGPQRTMMLRLPEPEPEPEPVAEDEEEETEDAEPEESQTPEEPDAPAGPQPTMTLRLSDLPDLPESADENEDADAEPVEAGAPAGPQPTMTLRMSDLAKAREQAADKAGDEKAEEAGKPAAKPQPTVMLRAADLTGGKGKDKQKAEDKGGDKAAGADAEAEAEPVAKPEPTMTLRVDKGRPEQTVMLRLPKEGAEAGAEAGTRSEPKPEPKSEPKSNAKTGPVPAPARTEPLPVAPEPVPAPPAPAASAAPVVPAALAAPAPAPAAPPPGPESTIEALEALKALSARPVSPLRRALKRITIWGVFVAFVLGVVVAAQLLRPLPAPHAKLSLTDSFTFGGEQPNIPWPTSGQAAAEVVGVGSLGASGEEKPVPIASVTKVMNAYLILQAHPLKKGESGPVLTVDKQAAQESGNNDESTVTLREGQQLTEYEALEMLMLPSANNVARLLARWDSGSEEEFLKKMNSTAAQLGMTNTTYADPAGYNNDTKSTAKDQLKLAEKVMQMEIFKQIVAEPDTRFNGQRIYNTNALLGKNGNIGVKTGSSTPAQSCLMWAAVKDVGGVQRMVLGVTLGQPQTKEEMSLVRAAQPPSQRINVAAQAALAGQTLAKQGDVVGYVDDGVGGKVPLVAAKDLTVAGWNGVTAHVTLTPVGKIAHTLAAGTQVGTLSAGEGEGRVEVPVTLQSDLAPASITSRLLRLG